jgi:hypothetical protein
MGSIREFISSIANPTADSSAQGASDQKPTISVSAKGDGSFVVTGSGFAPNARFHIRIVDDALTTIWGQGSSDSQGKFTFPTGQICKLPGNLHFSANDETPDPSDLTGTRWSNTVTTSCPPDSGGGDDPPDDPPGQSLTPGRPAGQRQLGLSRSTAPTWKPGPPTCGPWRKRTPIQSGGPRRTWRQGRRRAREKTLAGTEEPGESAPRHMALRRPGYWTLWAW